MSEPSEQRTPRWRLALAALAAAAVLSPVVIGMTIGTGGRATRTTTASAGFTPVSAPPVVPRRGTHQPAGALVALVVHPTTMRSAPGGPAIARVPTRTEFGSPRALWVVTREGSWLGVVSQLAGNGRVGWIPASSASLGWVNWRLEVKLSARRLSVIEGGRVLQRYTVAIGAGDAPTPTGRFAVTDRLTTGEPAGPYGCCILALSALAPHAIQGWSGGLRIAIHATTDTASIGRPASHGCLRLTPTEARWLLDHIPLGTPTVITA
jgi:lipoprotein-anchoring transpeptidase ErfK/SrfK